MSLDPTQAREFLARVIPWPQDEQTSYTNLHWTFVPKDHKPGGKMSWGGRACRSVADAINVLEWARKLPDTRDIYACMSSQSTAQEVMSAKGKPYYKAVRLSENAVALKSLYLDVDVKEGGSGYASQGEAISELTRFCTESGMPSPSMVVSSGGGLHVYWTMSRGMTVGEWYPLACALIAATQKFGLKCDAMVTTDAARILRVPGTLNHKTNPPKPVGILAKKDFDYMAEKIEKILEPFKVAGVLPGYLAGNSSSAMASILPPRAQHLAGDDDLTAGIETAMPRDELRACLDVIPNNGTDWNLWNTVGMRIYGATEGADYGLDEWQQWSDQIATEGKDSCEARWEAFHHSPPTRTGAGALVVMAREMLGDDKWTPRIIAPVPVQLPATLPATPQVAGAVVMPAPGGPDPSLPGAYSRDANGIIWLNGLDDDGKAMRIQISDYPMTDAWIQKNPFLLHFTTTVERGRVQQITLPLEVVGSQEMRKALQSQGFMLKIQPKLATEFFLSWIKKLQESKDAVASSPFGWTVSNGKFEGFVYGGRLFFPGGTRDAASADPVLGRQYAPTGELQPWIDAAKLITDQKRPSLDGILASAFAAPLVMFTGHRGMLLSMWSQESGIGKSTSLSVAQAVWGDPVKATQMLSDTANSVMNKIGEIRSLPMYWDELKTEDDTKKFVDITFRMTMGKEKSRMTRSVTQREVGSWQTLLVSASNDSILNYIINRTSTTTAGLHRVFEYEVTPGVTGQIDTAVASRTIARLNHNYGQVGLIYAEFLGNNFARVDKEIEALLKRLNEQTQAKQEERFWVALIGVLLMGAKYANELNFTDIDLKALKKFLLEHLENMRAERNSQPVDMKIAMNVSDKLAQFLNAMRYRHMIITNRVHIARGKPVAGTIKVLNGEQVGRFDGIYVHVGAEDKLLRISSTALTDWCADKGYSRTVFTNALAEEFGMKKLHGRIASGTQYAGITEYLLEIDLAGSPLLDFLSEQ